jgi:outer membrane protein OmpA-like peptidoglycan-associated protein
MRSATIAILLSAAGLTACTTVNEGVQRMTGRSAMVAAPTCQDFSFPLYFNKGSDQLTREGVEVIDANTARVRACQVAELRVRGLADAEGDPVANLQLSQRRATTVAALLSARGYPSPTFEAQGEAGAATAAGRTEPLRRRAEISVRFAAAAPVR